MQDLLPEVANLVEAPTIVAGSFSSDFLSIPGCAAWPAAWLARSLVCFGGELLGRAVQGTQSSEPALK